MKKYTKADGTILFLLEGKFHNVEGPAYIPLGNLKKAEYYINGIKYTKEKWKAAVTKDCNGVPFHKTASGRKGGRV